VRRQDEKGRDILERLKENLALGKKGLFALWGKGGTGKTRIASEVVIELTGEFGKHVVWASAEKRTDFAFSTLLDEIARQLGEPDMTKLALEAKEEAVHCLLAHSPALIVLDNFETVSSQDERARCVDFLAERANCPSLITSRQKVPAPARNIPLKGMSNQEAQELLDQLIEQTQESGIFTRQVRSRIIKTAESNPYIMLWMVAQIDEAQTPKKVLDELGQGKGPVAERVFDRSFTLQQVGKDGRATLLALTLFAPDASHEALAEVAGFETDLARLDEAAKNLRSLWLIGATEENERLGVSGLTRSLAISRLLRDEHADDYRQRFVARFLTYANAHSQPTPEDYDALEQEKDNLLSAMDVAFKKQDWESVIGIGFILGLPVTGMLAVHGYWDEAIRRNQQALRAARESSSENDVSNFAHNAAVIHQYRGEIEEARLLYNESLEINRRLGNEVGIANSLHELARLAYGEGKLEEARRLYHESLEISQRLDNQNGIAITQHQLALLAHGEGELEEAGRLYHESLAIKKQLGKQVSIATTLHQLARLADDQGNPDEARRLYHESLEINKRFGNQGGIALNLHNMGVIAQDQGELEEARRLYNESLAIKRKLGNQAGIATSLHQLASLAQSQGEPGEARQLYNQSLEIDQRLGNQEGIAISLLQLGNLEEDEGHNAEAARLFGEALAIFGKLNSPNAEKARRGLERVKGKSS
jgi:tetratricopeptide (TPR) repeat protein